MKLREKFKRFWTMDVHNHEGFTLVELIIVIAILAILSGVAVAGYSAYIKKANMQADKTMIAEIANSLTLAYYNGDLVEGGVIILSTEGLVNGDEIVADSALDKVMVAAFGTNWRNNLKLKYTDWTVSPAYNLLTAQAAKVVANSSFITSGNPDALMQNVSVMTNALADALAIKTDSVASLTKHLSDESIDYVKTEMGITDLNELDDTELSNFAMLAIAHEYSTKDEEDDGSTLVNLVASYAMYSAYIYSDYATEEDKAAYEAMNKALANTANADLTDYNGSVTQYAAQQVEQFAFNLDEDSMVKWADLNYTTDDAAIKEMMSALTLGSAEMELSDLSDPALATDGVLGQYFNDYINAAVALAANGDIPELDVGQVAICFGITDSIVIYTTID